MKQSVNLYDFDRAFETMRRGNSFSCAGKRALFEYLESYEEDTGEEIELDVVALCCNYSEYSSAYEAASEYGYSNTGEGIETREERALDWLRDKTTVIEVDGGGVIIQVF